MLLHMSPFDEMVLTRDPQFSQGINLSAIFTSCQDSNLASAKTVCNLLFPAGTAVHDKWLPEESVCVIWLPAKT